MVEFIEYSDEKIRIKLPKQLRQKRPIRLFRGNLIRGKPETHMAVGIDLNFDIRRFESIREEFLRPEIQDRPQGEKVERLGPSEFGDDGLELLTSIVQPHTGHTFYHWGIIFSLDSNYLMVSIIGGGSRENFENLAKEVVKSLAFI
jgi:hypothetical protein